MDLSLGSQHTHISFLLFLILFFIFHAEVSLYGVIDQLTKVLMTTCGEHTRGVDKLVVVLVIHTDFSFYFVPKAKSHEYDSHKGLTVLVTVEPLSLEFLDGGLLDD